MVQRLGKRDLGLAILACLMIAGALYVLEAARAGVSITQMQVGDTPITSYVAPGADGPAVVIAHGFAGSRQMMQGYALPLAQAGYHVHAFDFMGHGRHTLPMSGDVTVIEGTTQRLMAQTEAVMDAVAQDESAISLLGHSMATDVLVRVAAERPDSGPLVLISAFSRVIDATHPASLLMITGAWEPGLRDFALEAARMVSPEVSEGETARADHITRRAVIAPHAEHVAVLHSRTGRAEALDWLNESYGRDTEATILPTGWAILALLGGLVLLFLPVARQLPAHGVPAAPAGKGRIALAALLPAVLAPLLAVPLNPGLLPVLVADYLALHLAIFGLVQLALLRFWRIPLGPMHWQSAGLLLLWCILFGIALDRYAANFWPVGTRLWIISAIALGAVPAMLADARLTHLASLPVRIALRGAFLLSLGLAVALDFEALFFLLMIAPVIVLFYLVFGTMGRQTSARGGPLAPGLVLGLVLAWALGVSFPLFQA